MDPTTLSEYCIYTIVELATLEEAAREGTPQTFNEGKPWVTGHALLEKARGAGLQMPVLLGDATDCNRLLYWDLLTDVTVTEGGTSYTVDRVRELDSQHTPQDLELRSTGKKIAPNFIRPYAICETPDFLCDS